MKCNSHYILKQPTLLPSCGDQRDTLQCSPMSAPAPGPHGRGPVMCPSIRLDRPRRRSRVTVERGEQRDGHQPAEKGVQS